VHALLEVITFIAMEVRFTGSGSWAAIHLGLSDDATEMAQAWRTLDHLAAYHHNVVVLDAGFGPFASTTV
jgi:hypothetical protein